jgi:hypothetical protein
VTVLGLEDQPHFVEGVLTSRGNYQVEGIRREVVAASKRLVAADPAVGAVLLECTNLPPFARDIQEAVGLPVYDITTLARLAHAARFREWFAPASDASA